MSIHFQVHDILSQYLRDRIYVLVHLWYVTAVAIGSDIFLMDCRVCTLNVDRFIVLLHLSSCLLFRSVTNLPKSGARTVTPARDPC